MAIYCPADCRLTIAEIRRVRGGETLSACFVPVGVISGMPSMGIISSLHKYSATQISLLINRSHSGNVA